MEELARRLRRIEESIVALSARVSALESVGKELVPVGVKGEIKRELAAYHAEISKAIELVGEEATKKATNNVLTVVDRKIVPMINKTIEWVGYSTQDGNMVVDDYRRAVFDVNGGGRKFGNTQMAFDD
jgi:hypothetical protein